MPEWTRFWPKIYQLTDFGIFNLSKIQRELKKGENLDGNDFVIWKMLKTRLKDVLQPVVFAEI